jgi:hypothetical protein
VGCSINNHTRGTSKICDDDEVNTSEIRSLFGEGVFAFEHVDHSRWSNSAERDLACKERRCTKNTERKCGDQGIKQYLEMKAPSTLRSER